MRIFPSILISLIVMTLAAQSQTSTEQDAIRITRSASQPPRAAPADNFTGAARIDSSFQTNAPAGMSGARVVFEPGARTAWHTHPLGQLLVVTAGTGRVQRWGDAIDEIGQGDVVWIPPGQKHWHGAAPTTAMTHIAVQEQLDGKTVEWMEKVSDAVRRAAAWPDSGLQRPPRGLDHLKRAMDDFAPKLAEITDNVLYGDVWERPELSKRDRSLATVAAPIALNRPDQLRSHLAIARQKRCDAGGVDRDHHSPRLRRMAERSNRHRGREEVFGKK